MENNSYSNEPNNTNDSEDIDNMVLEVSNVLRNHLVNIFKNIKDDSATLEILNQLPMVKKMNENNKFLKTKIVELNSEIAVLKNDLSNYTNREKHNKQHLSLNVSELDCDDANGKVKQIILSNNIYKNNNLELTAFMTNNIGDEDDVSSEDEDLEMRAKKLQEKQDQEEEEAEGAEEARNEEERIAMGFKTEDEKIEEERIAMGFNTNEDDVEKVEDGQDDEEEVDEEEVDEEEVDEEEVDEEEVDEEEVDEEEDDEEEVDEEEEEEDEEEEDDEEEDDEEEEEDDEEEDDEEKKKSEVKLDEVIDLKNVDNKNLNMEKEIETEEEEYEEEEEDDLEVEEWVYDKKNYYITDANNGIIFESLENDEIGEEVGYFKNGEVFFS
jgi:hypothetical protein